ncbi:MAG: homoserine kinase [Pseudomonadota bacterium]
MAVYTQVPRNALEAFLGAFDLGDLEDYEGITQGVENTNYKIVTAKDRFILTLFEQRVDAADLPFFLDYMRLLSDRGVPAPAPMADRRGRIVKPLCGRPAIIISFLPGAGVDAPTPALCEQAGAVCARLHETAADFEKTRRNALDLEGWRALAADSAPRADECATGLSAMIAAELAFLGDAWPRALPSGVVHADLFPDNVFFKDGVFSGVIDFYFSCTEFYAYDLAITLCAWAGEGGWSREKARALSRGYQTVRPLSAPERAALPILLRGAALRFLLTRLHDWLHQVDGAQVRVKDPLAYRDLLQFLQSADLQTLGLNDD